jgi:hypothetical protein
MSSYIIRVEMHQKDFNYTLLHAEMKRHNCIKQIRSDKGVWYDLPEAEYCLSDITEQSPVEIRDFISEQLGKLGWSFWLIVTKYDSTAWVLRPSNQSNALIAGILSM